MKSVRADCERSDPTSQVGSRATKTLIACERFKLDRHQVISGQFRSRTIELAHQRSHGHAPSRIVEPNEESVRVSENDSTAGDHSRAVENAQVDCKLRRSRPKN